jgi:hypothetical protein
MSFPPPSYSNFKSDVAAAEEGFKKGHKRAKSSTSKMMMPTEVREN